jgi:hypothetical protein
MLQGATAVLAEGATLRLSADGSYTLTIGSVSASGPATTRVFNIFADENPDDEFSCPTSGNVDGPGEPVASVFSGGAEVSGVIANGEIAGSTTQVTDLADGAGTSGSTTLTVTWSLQPR